mmetsp:Transcript_62659/g.175137  ORF Transcript_62659/g.175137 Transcript_62659/m.175137 type:complete len:307 (-) Transcript_62659:791-1711(-)
MAQSTRKGDWMRPTTRMELQSSANAPRLSQMPVPLSSVKMSLIQQLSESFSVTAVASALHHCKKHDVSLAPMLRMSVALQVGPPLGRVSLAREKLVKVDIAASPATWLCQSGRINGMPESTVASIATPTKNTITKTVEKSTMHLGHRPTSCVSRSSGTEWLCFSCSSSMMHNSPLCPSDTSKLRGATLFLFRILLFSRVTRIEGMKSMTKPSTHMTQSPMKRPNSRKGCSTLARLAKKLTAVARDVAKQALPACDSMKAKRSSNCQRCTLWFQKSTKTKTTSLPMPTTKKIERNEAMVVFAAGVRT